MDSAALGASYFFTATGAFGAAAGAAFATTTGAFVATTGAFGAAAGVTLAVTTSTFAAGFATTAG